ncbi:MAG TPA: ribosome assembly RNA-binding protein YhbY [Oscillospiraceae bacterium]|nr:ribosome assembly RNA-binding protein YhbY [Oscillospiraceae bacterium]
MELTGKQRAQLRALANPLPTIVHIGKDGIGENLIRQANDALEARELVKCRVLESAGMTARGAADALAPVTRSEVVQVIGTRFVLYRPSHDKNKKDKIVLVPEPRKKA